MYCQLYPWDTASITISALIVQEEGPQFASWLDHALRSSHMCMDLLMSIQSVSAKTIFPQLILTNLRKHGIVSKNIGVDMDPPKINQFAVV